MPNTNTTLTDLFEDIADAIRGKDGTSAQITASDFPTRITAIPSGGGSIPAELLTLTGDTSYMFYNGEWDWFLRDYGSQINTNNITDCTSMFAKSGVTDISFAINLKSNSLVSADSMFNGSSIKTLPYLKGKLRSMQLLLKETTLLRNIPDDWVDYIDLSNVQQSTSNNGNFQSFFYYCYSLRKIPENMLKNLYSLYANGVIYSYGFQYCFTLDEIKSLPVFGVTLTSNKFTRTFYGVSRAKSITFNTINGTPYTANWKAQTIDLSDVGTASKAGNIISFNSGITADKEVTDASSYNTLKNDSDWFTLDIGYSRYNHDSAVETINSLPDTSAYLEANGGTNTIKFEGNSGVNTDGGAINTLTAAEIAVATAKGWTVTLV